LRRHIIELQASVFDDELYQRLQQEHISYVREAKQREMTLREQVDRLQPPHADLRSRVPRWDADETRDSSIKAVLGALRRAYAGGRGIEEALDDLTAIIAPDVLVRGDHGKAQRQSRIPMPTPASTRGRDTAGGGRCAPEGTRGPEGAPGCTAARQTRGRSSE